MALIVNHNTMASNVVRNLGNQYAGLSKSVRRLSSGLRVGQASDDAAGLAIREMMRAEIASLNQGIRNANDAISLLQTADGALAIVDEKLIRMKELAEQAATGTYNYDQRQLIHQEFLDMAAEIDRIANATDFNSIKLLDGSLSGNHDGSGLMSTGELKVHFGPGNDPMEDYYYIGGMDASGQALFDARISTLFDLNSTEMRDVQINNYVFNDFPYATENDYLNSGGQVHNASRSSNLPNLQDVFTANNQWTCVWGDTFYCIPKGSKNVVINILGYTYAEAQQGRSGDNDIQLFTKDGLHLAGTPLTDYSMDNGSQWNYIHRYSIPLPFGTNDYDDSYLNSGPTSYDGNTLTESTYNGMKIYYSGDTDQSDSNPNNGISEDMPDYEVLMIDEVTEDLVICFSGLSALFLKIQSQGANFDITSLGGSGKTTPGALRINTQEQAQKTLCTIDQAIIRKDALRAHIGALQNRLENTVSNLQIQAENLQASESRISDVDVAMEMTNFVRSQVLTQAAVTMLAQANSLPQMALQVIGG